MKIRVNRKKAANYAIMALWVFIIYIRQGAECFIGRIAWYANPLLYFAIIASLVLCLRYGPLLLKNSGAICCFLILSTLIQIVWKNYDISHGNIKNLVAVCTIVLLYLAFCNIDTNKWADFLLRLMIVVGVFYAFWTIVAYLSPSIYSRMYDVLKNFSHVNLLAYYNKGYIAGLTTHWTTNGIYITIGLIPAACSLFFRDNTKKEKRIIGILSAALMIALLLSAKRAHTVFSVFAVLVTYYFYHADKPKTRALRILLFIAGFLALFLVVANFIPGVMNVVDRFIEYSEEGDIGNGRALLQANIYTYIRRKPILGNGWEYFTYNGNSYMSGQHAHNVYLQLLCDTGIVGFALFMGFFVGSLFQSISTLVHVRKSKDKCCLTSVEERVLSCSVCYQVFFLCYCATGNPLYDRNCYFPYMMLCAASMYLVKKVKSVGE